MAEEIYRDELVRVIHGDCRKVLRTLPLAEIDCILTDPPYGIRARTDYRSSRGRRFPRIIGDDRPFEPAPWLIFPKVVLFGANHFSQWLPPSAAWFVWDRRDGVTTNCQADCELAWTNLPGTARIFRHLWSGFVKASERGQRRVHPTQKPVALMEWCIDRIKPRMILDPFMGSGTTLVAAKRKGIPAIGIEISKRYCHEAVKRLKAECQDREAV